jgi:protein SCO1/2
MRDYNGTSPLYSPRGGTGPNGLPVALQNVGIDQKLNERIPLDLEFLDETGRSVRLGEYFGKKPVILSLVFYECPMLCNQVLNGLVGSLKAQSFNVGEEFDVLTVSFDPREGPALASAKKLSYMQRYQRAGAEKGWHFLTGKQESIDALTRAVGFRYSYDAQTNQFAHASGIMVLTPDGRLSRYFYGIEYAPKDVRLALVESSANKIGSPVDQLLLYCYHYDPVTGKYGPTIINIIRIGGLLTMLGVAALVFFLQRRRDAARSHERMAGGIA